MPQREHHELETEGGHVGHQEPEATDGGEQLGDQRAEIAHITAALSDRGGNIVSIGTFPGEDPTNVLCIIKADEISRDDMVAAITPYVQEIVDIREA